MRLIPELLELHAGERPGRALFTYLKFDGTVPERWTYGELFTRAQAVAGRLTALELRGKPVLLVYPAGPDFAPAFFGALLAGAIATPVPVPRFESQYQRLESVAADCEPGAMLSSAATLAWLDGRIAAESRLRTCQWIDTSGEMPGETVAPVPPYGDDIAVLQYTSGSTSEARGVAVSHGNLAHNVATITREFQPSAGARLLSWLPHFHDMGLIGGVLSPLTWGGEAMLMSPQAFLQRPLRWLEAISEYGVEVSGAPNFAYEMCVKWARRGTLPALNLSGWRIAFVGAEPVRASTLAAFRETFAPYGLPDTALLPCYGMAEATLLVTCKPAHTPPVIHTLSREALERGRAVVSDAADAVRLTGCGYAVTETELRVVRPGSDEYLGPNEIGELWIRGPQVAQGYWKDAGAFQARLANSARTYLRSGDLGFLTDDGEFVFVERLKDLIVLNGQNYFCHDLELAATESHESLTADGCAVALLETGAEPHLAVVVEFPMDQTHRAEEAAAAVRGALFRVHGLAPKTIAFVPPGKLSRTTSGKLQRRLTVKRLASGQARLLAWSGEPLPEFLYLNGELHV